MNKTITPIEKLNGQIKIPGDKSISYYVWLTSKRRNKDYWFLNR